VTRRDRMALALALGWLRASLGRSRESHRKMRDEDAVFLVEMAGDALDLGGDVCDDVRAACTTTRAGRPIKPTRMLRARMAILLRAILRADAIASWDSWSSVPDPRMHCVCTGCGAVTGGYENGQRMVDADVCPVSGKTESARWPVPLWEQRGR
jgi:hypothetical protein